MDMDMEGDMDMDMERDMDMDMEQPAGTGPLPVGPCGCPTFLWPGPTRVPHAGPRHFPALSQETYRP